MRLRNAQALFITPKSLCAEHA